jgi:hypothetical protein
MSFADFRSGFRSFSQQRLELSPLRGFLNLGSLASALAASFLLPALSLS